MSPYWRRIESTIRKVKRNLEDLLDRSKRIDRHMDEFEQINRQSDRALQPLSSSSVTQFFIAGLVILIAINVLKLRGNNIDPQRYRDRLSAWEERITETDGKWQVINDLEQLEPIMAF